MKNRLLFLCPLPPPIHGASLVSKQIVDSKMINEMYECDYVNISASRKVEEIGHNSFFKLFRLIIAYAKALGMILTRRYDLCYMAITCHGIGFLKDAPFVLLCKLFCHKIIIHQHNKGMSNDFNKPVFRNLLPIVYNNTRVILLSEYLYSDISKVVKKEQISICPNGIPDIQNNENKHYHTIPHILFLSNMIVEKGVLTLLDALKIINERGFLFECDLVGNETFELSHQRIIEEITKRGLDEVACFHGVKYGIDKLLFFENADIFSFPTSNECFPLVILEAMRSKLPIISTSVGGIPDLVSDGVNGFMVEPNNAHALAYALIDLLCNEQLRKKMGEAGYELYHKQFTEQAFENRFCQIIGEYING